MNRKLPRWVVFLCRGKDAELGDLLEEYGTGRLWFWRQLISIMTSRPRRFERQATEKRRTEMLSNFWQDVRYAIRGFRQSPAFTTAAILAVALGIGVNTGIFSILNGLALRDLPAPDSGKLLSIYQRVEGARRNVHGSRSMFSTSEYRAYRDGARSLVGIMSYSTGVRATLGGASPQLLQGTLVSCNYFAVLELPPALGPGFAQTDCENPETSRDVILTYDLWVTRFAADSHLIGSQILLMYMPAVPRKQTDLQLLVRSGLDFSQLSAGIRAAANEMDPALVVRVNRLEDNLEFWRTVSRLTTGLAGSLGTLALLLASVGVYGVVSYAVSRRVREVGIRIALGANPPEVVRMILKQALRPVVVGLLIGLVAAAAMSKILESVLFGVSAHDVMAFVGAALFLLGVAALASWIPARRVTRLDAISTLRYE